MGAKYVPRATRGKNPQSLATVIRHMKTIHARYGVNNAELLALERSIAILNKITKFRVPSPGFPRCAECWKGGVA